MLIVGGEKNEERKSIIQWRRGYRKTNVNNLWEKKKSKRKMNRIHLKKTYFNWVARPVNAFTSAELIQLASV